MSDHLDVRAEGVVGSPWGENVDFGWTREGRRRWRRRLVGSAARSRGSCRLPVGAKGSSMGLSYRCMRSRDASTYEIAHAPGNDDCESDDHRKYEPTTIHESLAWHCGSRPSLDSSLLPMLRPPLGELVPASSRMRYSPASSHLRRSRRGHPCCLGDCRQRHRT